MWVSVLLGLSEPRAAPVRSLWGRCAGSPGPAPAGRTGSGVVCPLWDTGTQHHGVIRSHVTCHVWQREEKSNTELPFQSTDFLQTESDLWVAIASSAAETRSGGETASLRSAKKGRSCWAPPPAAAPPTGPDAQCPRERRLQTAQSELQIPAAPSARDSSASVAARRPCASLSCSCVCADASQADWARTERLRASSWSFFSQPRASCSCDANSRSRLCQHSRCRSDAAVESTATDRQTDGGQTLYFMYLYNLIRVDRCSWN